VEIAVLDLIVHFKGAPTDALGGFLGQHVEKVLKKSK